MIDIHTHLHPPRLFAAIRRWFDERSSWVLEHPTEPAAVAAALEAAGVTRFVFCSYAHKPGMAAEINQWLAETSRGLGRYGLPLATVHAEDPDPLGDLTRAFDDGCIGLKLHEDVQKVAVDDERLDAVYGAVAERRGFVLAHVGPIPWDDRPQGGPDRVGRVLVRHPTLHFVVAHLGSPDTARYVERFHDHSTLRLDTTMCLDPAGPMASRFDPAWMDAHPERFVYGTDYPNVPYAYDAERSALHALGLREATLRGILHDNAAELIAPFA